MTRWHGIAGRCRRSGLAVALVFAASGAVAAPKGDVNLDGQVSSADLLLVERHVRGAADGTFSLTTAQQANADVAPLAAGVPVGDGVVNAADLGVLARVVGGQTAFAPVLSYSGGSPTSSNPISVMVTAAPGNSVTIFVNGVADVTKTMPASGTLSAIAALYDGSNVVNALATANGGTSPASNSVSVSYANAIGNPPPGTISVDTVWTARGGVPYNVAASLSTTSNATLTIQPGAIVRFPFTSSELVVNSTATLRIRGTAASPVFFTSSSAIPLPGSWMGIRLASSTASAEIEYATIEYASTAIDVGAATLVSIRNSVIRRFASNGILVRPNGSAIIVGNTIGETTTFAGTNGIWLDHALDTVLISGNVIQKATNGLQLSASSPMVFGNTIRNNSAGIRIFAESNPKIQQANQILDNTLGLQISGPGQSGSASLNPRPAIQGNTITCASCFSLMSVIDFASAESAVIDAQGNWWGSADPRSVAAKIEDRKTAATAPAVDLTGFLNQAGGTPVPGAFLSRPITANTTITTGSTFEVLTTVSIVPGVTLTIQPGATLKFVNQAGLDAYGTLLVQGTSSSRPLFTSDATSPVRGNWDGLALRSPSVGSLVDYATVEYAQTGIDVVGASVTIRNSEVRLIGVSGAGIQMSAGAGGQVSDNLIHNVTQEATGIRLENASPAITGNILSGHQSGIRLIKDSHPVINGRNVITGNLYGVYIDGGTGSVGPVPNPIVNRNDFSGNALNLIVASVNNPSGSVSLNFRENWWGISNPTAVAIKAKVQESPASGHPNPQIDFSAFLDAAGGTPVGGASFLNVLTAVSASPDMFSAGAGESTSIQFALGAPATVTLTLCVETASICGSPVRTIVQSFSSAGTKSIVWNGLDGAANVVPDEAYSYELVADDGVVDGVNEGTFKPGRTPIVSVNDGSITHGAVPQFNAPQNQWVVFPFTLPGPGRFELTVGSSPNFSTLWSSRAFLAGPNTIVWDGRTAVGAPISGSSTFEPVPMTGLRPNSVITRGGAPGVSGGGAIPTIEVKSNPYLTWASYDQLSQLVYRVSRDAYVTVKLLPPGVYDPASPSALALVSNQLKPAQSGGQPVDHVIAWNGYDAAIPRKTVYAEEGTYTVTFQASGSGPSALQTSLTRVSLQLRR